MKKSIKIMSAIMLGMGLLLSFAISCKKDSPTLVLATSAVTGIGYFSATSGGTILSDGGSAITVSGICWSTNPNPSITDSKTEDGIKTVGSFSSQLPDLTSNVKYYVRAYATNKGGTVYGNEVSFKTVAD